MARAASAIAAGHAGTRLEPRGERAFGRSIDGGSLPSAGVVPAIRDLEAREPGQGLGELPLALAELAEQHPLLGRRQDVGVGALEVEEPLRILDPPGGPHRKSPSWASGCGLDDPFDEGPASGPGRGEEPPRELREVGHPLPEAGVDEPGPEVGIELINAVTMTVVLQRIGFVRIAGHHANDR